MGEALCESPSHRNLVFLDGFNGLTVDFVYKDHTIVTAAIELLTKVSISAPFVQVDFDAILVAITGALTPIWVQTVCMSMPL